MKLIVHELQGSGLSQKVIGDHNMIIEGIRPHLVRYGNPSGTLKLEIYDASNTLVATSETINISDIAPGSNYFHGYVRFLVNAGFVSEQEYTVKLVGSGGYSFDEAAYIGWCNGYDLGRYEPDYTPASYLDYPLDLEIWERKAR